MISPRCFEVASSYSTLTARMLAPVGPSILPRSTIAALPASSARVTSWVFFLGGIAFRAPSCVLHGPKWERRQHENAQQPRDLTTAPRTGSKRQSASRVRLQCSRGHVLGGDRSSAATTHPGRGPSRPPPSAGCYPSRPP